MKYGMFLVLLALLASLPGCGSGEDDSEAKCAGLNAPQWQACVAEVHAK
jgi:hypothetical protein